MADILVAEGLVKDFTGKRALDHVDLRVPEGAIYGLLGPNGAGKTTLIRIINHITAPDAGTVSFMGHRLTAADVARIGYLPEERGLYKKMRVGEQAVFFARLKGLDKTEATRRLRQWFDRLEISDWWGKKVEELSKGMAQKVQFIITVLHEPRLLIFDEPFSGFDPINAQLLKDEILRLRDKGATIIFSTHNMGSVEEICDHITLVNEGRDVLSGKVDEIRSRFCRDRYDMVYRGDPLALGRALEGVADDLRPIDGGTQLHLLPGATLRQALARANEAVELRSVNPALASMNEIFIKAVGGSLPATSVEETTSPQPLAAQQQ